MGGLLHANILGNFNNKSFIFCLMAQNEEKNILVWWKRENGKDVYFLLFIPMYQCFIFKDKEKTQYERKEKKQHPPDLFMDM